MSQKASGQSHVPLPAFIAFSLKTLGARFLPQGSGFFGKFDGSCSDVGEKSVLLL